MSPFNRRITRRNVLEALGLAGAARVAACASSPTGASSANSSTTTTTTTGTSSTPGSCVVAAEETAGLYPDRLGMIGNQFSDGTQTEMTTLNGDTTSGYTATLTVGISA